MATGQEIDDAARKMHNAALSLYVVHMDASENKDADVQCAIISWLIAAAAQLLWDGRLETSTPESLAGRMHFAALDLLRQLSARQRPQ